MKLALFASALTLLAAGCMPQTRSVYQPVQQSAMAPAPVDGESILWARMDGRRMATDPVLRQQGEADKARCEQEASVSGELQWNRFTACMNRSGYEMRRAG